jgi:hypothetical protein
MSSVNIISARPPEASKYLHSHLSDLAPEAPPCLNAGIQAGRWHNRRQIHRLQMIPPDEISCQNRFLPSQKWELDPHTSFWIGRGEQTNLWIGRRCIANVGNYLHGYPQEFFLFRIVKWQYSIIFIKNLTGYPVKLVKMEES